MMDSIHKLQKLYNKISKHSHYQILPTGLKKYIDDKEIIVKSRYEKERLSYVLSKVNVKNKKVLDVGGNTGYFSFELIRQGVGIVHYYEGNKTHANFVKEAANLLGVKDKIEINNKYLNFSEGLMDNYDIILLLNVLHHIGDDYGDKKLSKNDALLKIADTLKILSYKTKILILQLGFNWKGNIKLPLFESGLKSEMINFIRSATSNHWQINNIAVPQRSQEKIIYVELNKYNIKRDDNLGEFLNRPLFIMTSKNINEALN